MSRPHRRRPGAKRQSSAARAEVTRLLHGVVAQTLAQRDAGEQEPLTIPRAEASIGPARLAADQGGTEAERQARQVFYERCLAHYRAVVRPEDIESDDVGVAAAHFVAACFAALRGIRAAPDAIHRLEGQLVALVRMGPAWTSSDATARQVCFEQLAVLAVLFAGWTANRQIQAQPEKVEQARRGARTYLTRLLGLNPDMLTIGADGLTVARERLAA
jgi:hypothetical protein